jgi:hypothetical protein
MFKDLRALFRRASLETTAFGVALLAAKLSFITGAVSLLTGKPSYALLALCTFAMSGLEVCESAIDLRTRQEHKMDLEKRGVIEPKVSFLREAGKLLTKRPFFAASIAMMTLSTLGATGAACLGLREVSCLLFADALFFGYFPLRDATQQVRGRQQVLRATQDPH